MKFPNWTPKGVIPAVLLPMKDDLSVDVPVYRKHLQDVSVKGISALTVNGHSSEVHACTFDEQKSVLDLTLDEVGDKLPVICGIYADGSQEAARLARMAEAGGASCILVFPPNSMQMGGQMRPEMAEAHFKAIADATSLPIILFQYPMNTGLGYPFETLLRLFDAIPSIKAIKDWCNEPILHEKHIRTFQNLSRPVNVLTTHSSWLMASLSMGCNGLLSGSGSVIPELQVELFEAIKAGDLPRAQRVNDRIYPVAQAFYAQPFLDMHNRMKEALVMLGRIPNAAVRPPLAKLGKHELERIRAALIASGISGSEKLRSQAA
jgi:4-hydroxy-tetrahydrodipicolinate synthase